MGWLSLVQEKNILRNVFDAFDARNIGKFSVGDLENIITQIGGDPKRYLCFIFYIILFVSSCPSSC